MKDDFINNTEPSPETKAIVSYLPDTTYLNEQMWRSKQLYLLKTFWQGFHLIIPTLTVIWVSMKTVALKASKGNKEKGPIDPVISWCSLMPDEPYRRSRPCSPWLLWTPSSTATPNFDCLDFNSFDFRHRANLMRLFSQGLKIVRQGKCGWYSLRIWESIDQLFRHELKLR